MFQEGKIYSLSELTKVISESQEFKPVMGTYDTTLELFESNEYQVGDKIVQLIILPYPQIEFEEVEELSSSERGHGGFGSTGN